MLSGKLSIGRRRRKSRYYINESIYQQTPAWYVGASFSFHPECPVVWPCGDIDNSSLALIYHKDGMSYRLSACRGYFNRFSQVIIQFFGIPKWFAIKIHTWHLICFYYRHYHEKYDRLWSLFFARLTHHGILLERSRAISEQMGEKVKNRITMEKNADLSALRSRLQGYERRGVKLYFDGALSNTEYILKHCVMEDTAYMADYVTDREGKVREIRYDKISGK